MKIAISADGTTLEAPVAQRFGRTGQFLLYDTQSSALQVIENTPNLQAAQGAGTGAAETVAQAGADAVITGHCGPRALRTLVAAGIEVYYAPPGPVREALTAFEEGRLRPTRALTLKATDDWA